MGIASIVIIELQFRSFSATPYSANSRIWKHRVDDEKTLETIDLNAKNKGIEIDLYFFENNLYVSHDFPLKEKVLLSDFIKKIPNHFQIWFDLKNLNSHNVDQIFNTFQIIDKETPIKQRIFVESQNGGALKKLAQKGIHSIFWIFPYPKSKLHFFYNLKNKYYIATSNFIGVSMDYNNYDSRVKDTYQHIPKHLFTVNDMDRINVFKLDDSIRIILSDTISEN